MPVFTDALLGDTTHLSAEEFGAYCLLLFVTWRNNGVPLPDDAKRLARICRVTERRWTGSMRGILAAFFDLTEGTWKQKRLEKEWRFVTGRAAISRENGMRGGRPKSLKEHETENPTGSPQGTQTESTHTHTQEDSSLRSESASHANGAVNGKPRRGIRLPSDWVPSPEGRRLALECGVDPDELLLEFRDYWWSIPGSKGCKLDWEATWRNRCREVGRRRSNYAAPSRKEPAGVFAALSAISVARGGYRPDD